MALKKQRYNLFRCKEAFILAHGAFGECISRRPIDVGKVSLASERSCFYQHFFLSFGEPCVKPRLFLGMITHDFAFVRKRQVQIGDFSFQNLQEGVSSGQPGKRALVRIK